MKLFFSNGYIKGKLLLGLLYLAIGILSLLFDMVNEYFQYGFLILGILTLYKNHYDRNNYALRIEGDILTINTIIIKKKIKLFDFNEVLKTKTAIILSDSNKPKIIRTWRFGNDSINSLHEEIKGIINKEQNA